MRCPSNAWVRSLGDGSASIPRIEVDRCDTDGVFLRVSSEVRASLRIGCGTAQGQLAGAVVTIPGPIASSWLLLVPEVLGEQQQPVAPAQPTELTAVSVTSAHSFAGVAIMLRANRRCSDRFGEVMIVRIGEGRPMIMIAASVRPIGEDRVRLKRGSYAVGKPAGRGSMS